MHFSELDVAGSAAYPWQGDGSAFIKAVRAELGFDVLLLAVIEPRRTRPDAVLARHGVPAARLATWLEAGPRQDPLFKQALRTGEAMAAVGGDDVSIVAAGQHALACTLPATLDRSAVWLLVLGRDKDFTACDQQLAALLLRLVKSAYDRLPERKLRRMILANGQVLAADPRTEVHAAEHPELVAELADLVPRVIAQRWPDLEPGRPRDMILGVGGETTWVRARQRTEPDALLLELRPTDKEDPPAAGLLDDVRIARAAGYLTDHYRQSPSLNDVADVVETSSFHFHRLFSRAMGVSPKHFLLRTQLMIAKWLLRSTNTPVGEVATETGFSSHGHFTATFHRIVGVSPSAYRDRH